VAHLRPNFIAALTVCVCACTGATAAIAAAHTPVHPASYVNSHPAPKGPSHKRSSASARAARCRRYARKHPHAHAHCAKGHGASTTHHAAAKRDTRRSAPAHAGACAGADEMPSQENLALIRSATLCLINQERATHGESALQANSDLQQAAQQHASDMAFGDYFEHVGPKGDTPLTRIRASGYIYNSKVGYVIGENIAWGTLSLATPRAIVAAWVASPPHLANILNARYRDSAIGVSPHAPAQLSSGQPGGLYSETFGVIITG
jgi:uncharacterized protein YkwD